MSAQEPEAPFRRWLDEHLGLVLKVVRGCASPHPKTGTISFKRCFCKSGLPFQPFAAEPKKPPGWQQIAVNGRPLPARPAETPEGSCRQHPPDTPRVARGKS